MPISSNVTFMLTCLTIATYMVPVWMCTVIILTEQAIDLNIDFHSFFFFYSNPKPMTLTIADPSQGVGMIKCSN